MANYDSIITVPYTMARTNSNGNFAIVEQDGKLLGVKVWELAMNDTEKRSAFNVEAATKNYNDQVEKVANRKAEQAKNKKEKPVNEAAEAKRTADDAAIVTFFTTTAEYGHKYTSTEIMSAIDNHDFGSQGILAVGSALKRVAATGTINSGKDEKKRNVYYIGE